MAGERPAHGLNPGGSGGGGGGAGGIMKRASGGNDGVGGFPEMRLKLIAALLPVGGQGCPVALACAALI